MDLNKVFIILTNRNGLLPCPGMNLTELQLYQHGKSLEHCFLLLCVYYPFKLVFYNVIFQWVILASWIRNHSYERI